MKENEKSDLSFGNPLKKYSFEKIEEIIAKCLSDLVNEDLEVNVKFMDCEPNKKRFDPNMGVEIHLIASKPFKKPF